MRKVQLGEETGLPGRCELGRPVTPYPGQMHVLVVGIANLQTTLPVDGFPVEYEPVRYLPHKIRSTFGGVGLNQARQLAALGDHVQLAAPIGTDATGTALIQDLKAAGIDGTQSVRTLEQTPRSVILVEPSGRRAIFTDLGGALDHRFEPANIEQAIRASDAVVLANLDFSRPLLPVASSHRRPVAVDLQVLRDPDDAYHQDFLAADLLSLSHEGLGDASPGGVLRALRARSAARLVVITLGADGCLAAGDGLDATHIPAQRVPGDTAGAGDCFFASLVHYLLGQQCSPETALAQASAATEAMLRQRPAV